MFKIRVVLWKFRRRCSIFAGHEKLDLEGTFKTALLTKIFLSPSLTENVDEIFVENLHYRSLCV